jgi:hypothetical protein
MLIRISLIVAILAGLGVAGIAFFPLQDEIKKTISERDTFNSNLKTEKKDHAATKAKLASTQTELTQTKTQLVGAQQERDAAKSTAAEAVKKAEDLQANLAKAQQDLVASKDKLAAWEALGIQITQARDILNSLKRITDEKNVLEEEKAILLTHANKLQAKVNELTGVVTETILPEGLSGKVLVVDPKFDFVVLDIGEKQGALPHGKLLVSRNGKLVAKLVITENISQTQCVANVIPGPWKQSDIREGDLVFY